MCRQWLTWVLRESLVSLYLAIKTLPPNHYKNCTKLHDYSLRKVDCDKTTHYSVFILERPGNSLSAFLFIRDRAYFLEHVSTGELDKHSRSLLRTSTEGVRTHVQMEVASGAEASAEGRVGGRQQRMSSTSCLGLHPFGAAVARSPHSASDGGGEGRPIPLVGQSEQARIARAQPHWRSVPCSGGTITAVAWRWVGAYSGRVQPGRWWADGSA